MSNPLNGQVSPAGGGSVPSDLSVSSVLADLVVADVISQTQNTALSNSVGTDGTSIITSGLTFTAVAGSIYEVSGILRVTAIDGADGFALALAGDVAVVSGFGVIILSDANSLETITLSVAPETPTEIGVVPTGEFMVSYRFAISVDVTDDVYLGFAKVTDNTDLATVTLEEKSFLIMNRLTGV